MIAHINSILAKKKYIRVFSILLILTVIIYFICKIENMPYTFVSRYLDIRYNMNYDNIDDYVPIQKAMFHESVLEAGYPFTDFENDMNIFKVNKLKYILLNKHIYDLRKDGNIITIKADLSVEVVDGSLDKAIRQMNATFEFKLEKKGWNKFFISYIKEHNREFVPLNNLNQHTHQ